MLLLTGDPVSLKEELRDLETQVSGLRLRQAVIVNELDKVNTAGAVGHRSINEWLSATLDVSKANTNELVYAGRHFGKHRNINFLVADGHIGFDRAVAMLRLADAGADQATLDASEHLDLAAVRRLTAHRRRVTRRSERQIHADRYLSVQPTLDESAWRLSGLLAAVDGEIVARALDARADELRLLPGADITTRGQRQADALIAMAHDAAGTGGGTTPQVSILVDLGEANRTGGETGAEIAYGPRVGPAVLEELLCTGTVRVVGLKDGTPIVTSQATGQIPPSVRSFVARRDGGCTIAGCTSRYRLEPHHITPRSQGGTNDPENLTTLCWFHHHIAIHRHGLHIDPDSPPMKRRLTKPRTGPDPP